MLMFVLGIIVNIFLFKSFQSFIISLLDTETIEKNKELIRKMTIFSILVPFSSVIIPCLFFIIFIIFALIIAFISCLFDILENKNGSK